MVAGRMSRRSLLTGAAATLCAGCSMAFLQGWEDRFWLVFSLGGWAASIRLLLLVVRRADRLAGAGLITGPVLGVLTEALISSAGPVVSIMWWIAVALALALRDRRSAPLSASGDRGVSSEASGQL